VFSYQPERITKLDLIGTKKKENPFLDSQPLDSSETHLFITDYKPIDTPGDTLIKTWKLRDTHPCQFFQVNEGGEKYFKVEVEHRFKKDYLKLHKLPVDMFYMAEYLNEAVQVGLNELNNLDYIFITAFGRSKDFMKKMEIKELRFFGCVRSEVSNDRTIDYTRKTPIDNKKLET